MTTDKRHSPGNPWLAVLALTAAIPGVVGTLILVGSYGSTSRPRLGDARLASDAGLTGGRVAGILLVILASFALVAWMACQAMTWQQQPRSTAADAD